jgi:hypothetical protein
LHPVHRQDVGMCDLWIEGNSSAVAVAMTQPR